MTDRTTLELCRSLHAAYVFSHYAWGDPLEANAQYFDSDGVPAYKRDAAPIYVRCQRHLGHDGMHMASRFKPWSDDETDIEVPA